mmetsp:Transcript_23101/g.41745  ORF Transcript_23101/g.41745 Transcript_23101/m.41745 type:complete len:431 (+) Transcript_23101:55-1347(+)
MAFRSLQVLKAKGGRGLTTKTLDLVKATLPAVAEAGPAFTGHFYKRMFKAHPELLNTFNVANQRQGRQQKALFNAVAACAVNVLEHGCLPTEMLEGVHHKHCALDVQPAQYDVVAEHIIGTIVEMLDPGQEVLDAWGELYGAVADRCVTREEEIYKQTESLPGGWRGLRKFKVVEKTPKSEVITKFTFAPADGQKICEFIPGQYTSVWLQPDSWDNRQVRHYSLVSDVGTDSYSIAVKKEHNGLMSSYLHDRLAVGDEVDLSAPFGNFNIGGCEKLWTSDPNAPVVMLSAGVGITPMLGMLGNLKNGVTPQSRPVVWMHAAKNGHEHAFRDYLVGLARAHPDEITRRVWYESPSPDDVKGMSNRSPFHYEGLMDLTKVKSLLPLDESHAQYFFCGPQEWMKMVGGQLLQLGVHKENLHFEAFGPSQDIFA